MSFEERFLAALALAIGVYHGYRAPLEITVWVAAILCLCAFFFLWGLDAVHGWLMRKLLRWLRR